MTLQPVAKMDTSAPRPATAASGSPFSDALSHASAATTHPDRTGQSVRSDKKQDDKKQEENKPAATSSPDDPGATPPQPSNPAQPQQPVLPVTLITGQQPAENDGSQPDFNLAALDPRSSMEPATAIHGALGNRIAAPDAATGAASISEASTAAAKPASELPAVGSEPNRMANEAPTAASIPSASSDLSPADKAHADARSSAATSAAAGAALDAPTKSDVTSSQFEQQLSALLPSVTAPTPLPVSALGSSSVASMAASSTDGAGNSVVAGPTSGSTSGNPRGTAPVSAGKAKSDNSGSASASPATISPTTKFPVVMPDAGSHDMAGDQAHNTAAVPQNLQAVLSASSAASADPQAAKQAQPTATTDAANTIPTPQPASSSWDPASGPVVHSAQIIQAMHQSEMRMGMNSAEFGNISITTSVTHQTLSAQISLDHAELSRALAIHLPSIEEKLGSAYGLQARVEVRDNSATSQGDASGRDRSNAQGQGKASSSASLTPSPAVLAMGASRSSSSLPAASARLDIMI